MDVREMDATEPPDPMEGTDNAAPPGEADEGWLTVFEGATRLDLLNMAAAPRFLAAAEIPAGEYDQVRLVLAPDAEMMVGTELIGVDCPSCTESGLKVLIPHGVAVNAGESLDLTLDFARTLDADRARLDPVIRAYVSRD